MVKALHKKLVLLFSDNGYKITFDHDTGIEMKSDDGFTFSDMIDGEYIEARLCTFIEYRY